jgi:Transposase
VLPANAGKSAQTRFRQSGAKDDRWDAHWIADLLRTDPPRDTPWKPDQPRTRQIRAEVRFAQQLGRELIQNENRLRALRLRYYPAALEAFPNLDRVVGLAFVQTYSPLPQAQALSFEQLKLFLGAHHHTQVRSWPKL